MEDKLLASAEEEQEFLSWLAIELGVVGAHKIIEVFAQFWASYFLVGDVLAVEAGVEMSRLTNRVWELFSDHSQIWPEMQGGGPFASKWRIARVNEPTPDPGVDKSEIDPFMYDIAIFISPDIGTPDDKTVPLVDWTGHAMESSLSASDLIIERMERSVNCYPPEEQIGIIKHRLTGTVYAMTYDQACALVAYRKFMDGLGQASFDDVPDLDDWIQGISDQMSLVGDEWAEARR